MTAVDTEFLAEMLRAIRADIADLKMIVMDLSSRTTSVEVRLGQVHSDIAGQSVRLDRIDGKMDRIERRLGLVSA